MKFSNITKGKKTTAIGGGVAILTCISYILAIFYPENEASIYIIDNATEIVSTVTVVVSMLVALFDK